MKTFTSILFLLFSITWINAQTSFKHIVNHPGATPQPLQIAAGLPSMKTNARQASGFFKTNMGNIISTNPSIASQKITSSGSFWITMHDNQLWASRSSLNDLMGQLIPNSVFKKDLSMEWSEVSQEADVNHVAHIRLEQMFAGKPIHGQDMILHIRDGQVRDLNGFAWTGNTPEKLPETIPVSTAMNVSKQYLKNKGIQFQPIPQLAGITTSEDNAALVWYPVDGKLVLTYEINMHPNMLDHWTLFVNASSMEIVNAYSLLCSIFPSQLYKLPVKSNFMVRPDMAFNTFNSASAILGDGPTTISDQDLLGINRTVNAYLIGSNFFMIDASRAAMFNATQSVIPNEPNGAIWTLDGQNGSPQKSNFTVIQVSNSNNNWTNLQVSAHSNAGIAFEYYKNTFNRLSINGTGGNIISLINIADENGNAMDNAYWNGSAMFYGNGDQAFIFPLAKALDVSGHELSHGVIQNTANLDYENQSGALNESFADVFGSLIERKNFLIGEDVSNPAIFPTGALRDMLNPNNGGSGPNDPGWQPKHMNEFQTLPNTPAGDNGGVHVNSGIPNRAFALIATAIGKDKAEQIYYHALKDYLVKSSQFVDMRNAAEKAAEDLHGAGSTEVMAIKTAFDAVGIGAGQGDDHQGDIQTGTGSDFIIVTDDTESDLYWVPPSNPSQFVKMNVPAPISRPSFTDDGTACVYIDNTNNMILLTFDWSAGLNFQKTNIENNPQGIWRNIVASKDGSKIAYTTSNLTNEIWVYDFNSSSSQLFTLYNPTTAQGQSTGDVEYPDAMEWDYSGEFVMYDALNKIGSSFGDGIEYWDISFLKAWDNQAENFGLGQIDKLFSSLAENVSIGNPSFAKNSPYIITFDYLETTRDNFGQEQTDYRIKAANIEAGIVNDIFQNTTIGYPSYSRLDNQILFTYDDAGTLEIATINLQANDKTLPVQGSGLVLLTGAQKGVWFQTGTRIFTGTKEIGTPSSVSIFPQPTTDEIRIASGSIDLNRSYTISDLTGGLLIRGNVGKTGSIDVSSLSPGMYVLETIGKTGLHDVAKFVKQ